MIFANSHLLFLLLFLPVIFIAVFVVSKRKQKYLSTFVVQDMWDRVVPSFSKTRRFWKTVLLLLTLLCVFIAVLRPQYGTKLTKITRRGQDILIALDTSLSMLTKDVRPNRFDHAKREVSMLIENLKGDRIGLMVFAGAAITQCPLTQDYDALRLFLDDMMVGMVPRKGSDMSKAIHQARLSFKKNKKSQKILIIFSDGEYFGKKPTTEAQLAAKEGINIYTVGIGTKGGDPVPVLDEDGQITDYKRNRKGQIIVSKLNEAALKEVSHLTKGKSYLSNHGHFIAERLYQDISNLEKQQLGQRLLKVQKDRYQIPIFFAALFMILFLFISDRKKVSLKWTGRVGNFEESDD